jgi:hypothetical protein
VSPASPRSRRARIAARTLGLLLGVAGVVAAPAAAQPEADPTGLTCLPSGTRICRAESLAIGPNGEVYVGGAFDLAGGVLVNNVAVWVPAGSGTSTARANRWSGLSGGVGGDCGVGGAGLGQDTAVLALAAAADGSVYAGGTFTEAGGVRANGIARWDGTRWSAVGCEGAVCGVACDTTCAAPSVRAIAIDARGDVYVAGQFDSLFFEDGDTLVELDANQIARWDGTRWHALGRGIEGRPPGFVELLVDALAPVPGGGVYAGGLFDRAGGGFVRNAARWDGTAWSALTYGGGAFLGVGPGIADSRLLVHALAVAGPDVYLGGVFDKDAAYAPRIRSIARWDGATMHALGSGFCGGGYSADGRCNFADDAVHALALQGGAVFAGGAIEVARSGPAGDQSVPVNSIARWDGMRWSALAGPSGEGVRGDANALAVAGGDLYVAGDFTEAGGIPVNRIARWTGSDWHALTQSPADFRLVALEVNQSVQDWNNSIPWIRDKATMVRAHVESIDGALAAFTARLRGFRDGRELAASPLAPSNGPILAGARAADFRGILFRSLNFDLPNGWREGRVRLQLEHPDLECAGDRDRMQRENLRFHGCDCRVERRFEAPLALKVRLIFADWDLEDSRGQILPQRITVPEARPLHDALEAMFPVAGLVWLRQNVYLGTFREPDVPRMVRTMRALAANRLRTCGPTCDEIWHVLMPRQRHPDDPNGKGFTPGAVSASFLPDDLAIFGRNTMAHEVGHNVGRQHAVSDRLEVRRGREQKIGWCGETAAKRAPTFPYRSTIRGRTVATLGPMDRGDAELVFGLDTSRDPATVVDPASHYEIMSYCAGPDYEWRWISKHTYERLLVATCPGDPGRTPPCPAPTASSGALTAGAAPLAYLIVSGEIDLDSDAVSFAPLFTIAGPPPGNPPPGAFRLQGVDAGGNVVAEAAFEPLVEPIEPPEDGRYGYFLVALSADPAIRGVRLLRGAVLVGEMTVSGAAPTVRVLVPNGGETLAGATIDLQWLGEDADGDELSYDVEMSPDGGTTWRAIALEQRVEALRVPRAVLGGTDRGLLRVTASDGFDRASDVSDGTFAVAGGTPVAAITSPGPNALYSGETAIRFAGTALDDEDGELAGPRLAWTSDRDGALGGGSELTLPAATLSDGEHVITLDATDGDGEASAATVAIQVYATPPSGQPVAEAGSVQGAVPGEVVTLDGSASADPDGDALGFAWRQVGGSAVALSDAAAVSPTFRAPHAPAGTVLAFELVVSDGALRSRPDAVAVILEPTAASCVGDCDSNGQVVIGELITAVNIAGGTLAIGQCPAVDIDGDLRVAINELIAAVGAALDGCGPGVPTPTAAPSPVPTAPASPTMRTPAVTPSPLATPTSILPASPSATVTATSTATPMSSGTNTTTRTPPATATRSATRTGSPTPASTATATSSPSGTPTATVTATATRPPTTPCNPQQCGGGCTILCPDGSVSGVGLCRNIGLGCTCVAPCLPTPGACNPQQCGGPCAANCPRGPVTGVCTNAPGGNCLCLAVCPL